jgi:NFU1 iron-sulfur cluster scaffold homolog, mitochondrial
MFVQTEITPNPNALKFLPGKAVSNNGSFEITKKEESSNELVRSLLSINGVTGIFLGSDFLSVNKEEDKNWEDIKHIVISLINEHYSDGKEFVIDKNYSKEKSSSFGEIEKRIIKILDTKIRPAVAKDGGDIKFKEFKDGVVKVELQGSCSGCPSSTMTLKQGVQNLLCHYLPEVKEVVAV